MIAVREIIALAGLNFGVDPVDIVSDNRRKPVVQARRVAMYVARKVTALSSIDISRDFRCDHTTVLLGAEKVADELQAAPHGPLAALVRSMEAAIAFRERVELFGAIDVLSVSRRIAAHPSRQAISATVMETAALAATVLDLWSVAEAAEELARLLQEEPQSPTIPALAAAIADEMAAIRGTNPEN